MSTTPVRAWREEIKIPTYGIGCPDRNPMFLDKRVYQGASGRVYPLRVIDRIDDEKHDRPWHAVFLENEYLKIMILPELGGRVQMALDKTNDYHFVYYNRVIKPALVGLAGPWISGGIEFNWPQHHRPGTFMPTDCEVVRHDDGSATVWCNEIDRMYGSKGRHGLRLRPGRAVLEIEVHLDNRTDLPQTFLWWANPAIAVDDDHQSIFPPDVTAVMDHGKRDVSSFPIATGTYYKIDYSPGTDISRYKNIPVPTSYMAWRSDYDFVGSYDHGRHAGLLHVCDRHISPGKKQWTWGKGEFGFAWDRQLTDEDGPYIELMCGVYTDNQPDFAWLMPGERKSFTQHFLPYKGVGVVHNATTEAAVGLEIDGRRATVRAYVTAPRPGARALLTLAGRTVLDATFDGDPSSFFETSVELDDVAAADVTQLCVAILDCHRRELVAYQPRLTDTTTLPEPARPIDVPEKLDSPESLYLAGRHLEQYHHATREPADYYREGLRRDPGDARCNNALGLLLLRRGRFQQAAEHFRRAIDRLTRHNPNPYDGEPFHNLGLALELEQRFDEAYDAYYKSTWNAAWQAAGHFALARIDCRRGRFDEALGQVDACLARNGLHLRARHLRVHLLGRLAETRQRETADPASCQPAQQRDHLIGQALDDDPFNAGVLHEQALAAGDWSTFDGRMRDDPENYLLLAIDCVSFGDEPGALELLEHFDRRPTADSSRVLYYLADLYRRAGRNELAHQTARRAMRAEPDEVFARRLETIGVLRRAIRAEPDDDRAPYELGNLLYDKGQHDEAIALWEKSRQLSPDFPTAARNLGLAYFNVRRDGDAAWEALHAAFMLDQTDARVLFELDQLARRLAHDPSDRLERLLANRGLVGQRDDLYLELVTLLNLTGRHREALDALLARNFHPWEGGEGKVPAQYTLALTQLARAALHDDRAEEAIDFLERALNWPPSLGEGKLAGIQENNIHYLLGVAHQQSGKTEAARQHFEHAAQGLSEPTDATYYNDQPPEMIFYQGLAQWKLGREGEAVSRFQRLVDYGREHLDDEPVIDYFAVSLPDFLVFDADLVQRNQIHCHFMLGLGILGLYAVGRGDRDSADEHFQRVIDMDPAHLGALVHRAFGVEPSTIRPTQGD